MDARYIWVAILLAAAVAGHRFHLALGLFFDIAVVVAFLAIRSEIREERLRATPENEAKLLKFIKEHDHCTIADIEQAQGKALPSMRPYEVNNMLKRLNKKSLIEVEGKLARYGVDKKVKLGITAEGDAFLKRERGVTKPIARPIKARRSKKSLEEQVNEMIKLLTRIMRISQKMGGQFLDIDDDAMWENEDKLRGQFNTCHKRLRKIGQELLDMWEREGDKSISKSEFQKRAYSLVRDYFLAHPELCLTGYVPTGYIEEAWRGLSGLW